jgi:hypothetical protein
VPDTTGAGLYQHSLALVNPGAFPLCLPCGDRDQRRGRRLDERQPSRLACQVTLVCYFDFLVGAGRGPEPSIAEIDLIPRLHASYGCSDGFHDPGAVPSEHGWQRPADDSIRSQLVIDRIDAGRPQPDQNLAIAGDLGLRQLGELEYLLPVDVEPLAGRAKAGTSIVLRSGTLYRQNSSNSGCVRASAMRSSCRPAP